MTSSSLPQTFIQDLPLGKPKTKEQANPLTPGHVCQFLGAKSVGTGEPTKNIHAGLKIARQPSMKAIFQYLKSIQSYPKCIQT